MAKPQPTRKDYQDRTFALPLVEFGQELSETAALAIIQDLVASHSVLLDHIKNQVHGIFGELIAGLEVLPEHPDVIVIRRDQLKGAIGKAALRGAAQAVSDIGQTTLEIHHMEQQLAAILPEFGILPEDDQL